MDTTGQPKKGQRPRSRSPSDPEAADQNIAAAPSEERNIEPPKRQPPRNTARRSPGKLTPLGVFNHHLAKAVENFSSLVRYITLFAILASAAYFVMKLWIDFSHEVVTMALTNTEQPWGLRLFTVVLVCGMPAMLFRPRIAVNLIRAVVSLARQSRNNNNDPSPGA
jgi:hypothetical protein